MTAQELDASLSPTGRQYSYQIASDLGAFSPTSPFGSRYIGVNASGYYFDEATGAVSTGTVTLSGYYDLQTSAIINVNIMTTLASQRVKQLVADSKSFADAATQAEREVLDALKIPRGNYGAFASLELGGSTDSSALLAAISSLFVQSPTAGEMTALINNFQNDLGPDGLINRTDVRAALAAAAATVNPSAIAANLTRRYGSLGVTHTAASIASWIDHDNDGVVGSFEFSVANANAASSFTLPPAVVARLAGLAVQPSGGVLSVNGTPVTSPVTINSNDSLIVTLNAGSLSAGSRRVYLMHENAAVARVTFVVGLVSVEVSPASASFAKGLTQQFTATAAYTDGSSALLNQSVTWGSSAPAIVAISSGGLATGVGVGSTEVTATYGGVSSAGRSVTVTPATSLSLQVSPAPAVSGVGLNTQITSTALYTDSSSSSVTHLTNWTSDDPSVASIHPTTGVLTGVAAGTTTIRAGFGVLTGTTTATIVNGAWVAGLPMSNPHGDSHTSTLLPSGEVLVVGGRDAFSTGATNTADLYEPASQTWSAVGPMTHVRLSHTATLLANGNVLVAAGTDRTPPMNTTEIFNSSTRTWSPGPSMSTARHRHAAARLLDGRVLVVGGATADTFLASAEIYDPIANTWTSAPSMSIARAAPTATRLADGRVLVVGSTGANAAGSAEVYDPVANSWSATPNMSAPRWVRHTATLLTNGKVLITGGAGPGRVGNSYGELYDPQTNTWSQTSPMINLRDFHTAALMADGKVIVIGESNASSQQPPLLPLSEFFDPMTGSWSAGLPLGVGRNDVTVTVLNNQAVLVVGGMQGFTTPLTLTEQYR